MCTSSFRATMAAQDGVVNRRQAVAAGLTDADIRRLVRRREWARVHPGVYVDHTGPLTWRQRAWAAVLYAEPAALYGESALRDADGPGRRTHDDDAPIHVVVTRHRQSRGAAGVVVHHAKDLGAKVQWNRSPPRERIEEAVLDVAAACADDFDAVAVVSAAVGSRRTTAKRLLEALDSRTRLARREFLRGVLEDASTGACSALERAYLCLVERAHGLPVGQRQVAGRSAHGTTYGDVRYDAWGLDVELDGRLDHSAMRDRDRDLQRDLDAALDGRRTVRLGWGQAVGRPCATAVTIGALLTQRGWLGQLKCCPSCRRRDSQSPGD